jgi:hypothetical protein
MRVSYDTSDMATSAYHRGDLAMPKSTMVHIPQNED